MPTVSVIIPTYNAAAYLGQALESVLAQTFTDYEIIVVDDGSTDGTRERLQPYLDRIRYMYQANQERSIARNRGLATAQGDYIAFLDADDLLLPGKLAAQVAALAAHPELGLVAGGHCYINRAGETLGESKPWLAWPDLGVLTWLFDCPMLVHAPLVRREWLEKVSGFDGRLRQVEDRDLWLRLAQAGCRMGWVEAIVCAYRLHGANTAGDAVGMNQNLVQMLDRFFSQPGLPEALGVQRDRVYEAAYLSNAIRAYGAAQIPEAQRWWVQAVKLNPRLLAGETSRWVALVAAAAHNPLITPEPASFIATVFQNLPDPARGLRSLEKKVRSRVAMACFFEAFRRRDWPEVRRHFWPGITNDPAWLVNRGVISIWLQAVRAS